MSISFAHIENDSALRQLVEICERRSLSNWEREFIASIRARRFPPTDKQMGILRRIASGAPNYEAINAAAIRALPEILYRWLPGGRLAGPEYLVRNPRRGDRSVGSFSVNLTTGKWADFAADDGGGDVISLAAWLFDLSQPEAARRVANMVGVSTEVANG